MMTNRYIYHYNAMNGNVGISGIAQLTFRITSQGDLNKLKAIVNFDGFVANSITSLSFLGMEQDNPAVVPDGWTNCDSANDALVMLDRIDTLDAGDDARIEEVKKIIRHLAAAPRKGE